MNGIIRFRWLGMRGVAKNSTYQIWAPIRTQVPSPAQTQVPPQTTSSLVSDATSHLTWPSTSDSISDSTLGLTSDSTSGSTSYKTSSSTSGSTSDSTWDSTCDLTSDSTSDLTRDDLTRLLVQPQNWPPMRLFYRFALRLVIQPGILLLVQTKARPLVRLMLDCRHQVSIVDWIIVSLN